MIDFALSKASRHQFAGRNGASASKEFARRILLGRGGASVAMC